MNNVFFKNVVLSVNAVVSVNIVRFTHSLKVY